MPPTLFVGFGEELRGELGEVVAPLHPLMGTVGLVAGDVETVLAEQGDRGGVGLPEEIPLAAAEPEEVEA